MTPPNGTRAPRLRPVLALDVGGTGSRAMALLPDGRRITAEGDGIAVRAAGIPVADLLDDLALQLRDATGGGLPDGDGPRVVCLGMSGLLGLTAPDAALAACRSLWPRATLVVASDAVTALAAGIGGPLSHRRGGGAVVSAGTGVVALGTDWDTVWHRVDGWGHVLGDDGGGAWIGRAGLASALRAHDGRGGSAALLAAVRTTLGPPEDLPRAIYTRDDRAGVLAAFARCVADAARAGDAQAAAIWADAGQLLAISADAALAPGVPERVALVGGLVDAGDLLVAPFLAEIARRRPSAVVTVADAQPLQGALRLALDLEAGTSALRAAPPFVTVSPGSTA